MSTAAAQPPSRSLTLSELNRALLARQGLLERAPVTPLQMIEQLVGLQSQAPSPPFTGLWSRVEDFRFDQLSQLMVERTAVRMTAMRGTVHLLSAADALGLRPVVQPVIDRQYWTNHGKLLTDVAPAEVAERARAVLVDGPVGGKQLGEALQQWWPQLAATELLMAARTQLALVQVPPRGLWGGSGQPTYALAEQWLDAQPAAYPLETVVRRYLAAFGPASVKDCQQWSGLTGLAATFAALADELVPFTGPAGEQLYDLPDAPRPSGGTPAPVRLIPEFDNLTLSHADRARVIGPAERAVIASSNGMVPGMVLINGFVGARYKVDRTTAGAVLTVDPFRRLTRPQQRDLTVEGEALLDAMGAGYAGGEVAFKDPTDRPVTR